MTTLGAITEKSLQFQGSLTKTLSHSMRACCSAPTRILGKSGVSRHSLRWAGVDNKLQWRSSCARRTGRQYEARISILHIRADDILFSIVLLSSLWCTLRPGPSNICIFWGTLRFLSTATSRKSFLNDCSAGSVVPTCDVQALIHNSVYERQKELLIN